MRTFVLLIGNKHHAAVATVINLEALPADVCRIAAIEPATTMRRRLLTNWEAVFDEAGKLVDDDLCSGGVLRPGDLLSRTVGTGAAFVRIFSRGETRCDALLGVLAIEHVLFFLVG